MCKSSLLIDWLATGRDNRLRSDGQSVIAGLLDRVDNAYGARKIAFRHDILQQWDAYGKRWSKQRHRAIMQVFSPV